jgi:uncharacterized protein
LHAKEAAMEEILEKLTQINGITAALIIGKDGLIIEFKGNLQNDPDFIGATVADFYTTAESIVVEKFTFGDLDKISIETSAGTYFLNAINNETFLVTIARENVNLGLMRLEIKTATENLREVLNV